jgi:hypothetical protein
MNWEIYLKEKAHAKTGRKKVAYVSNVETVDRAIEIALKRAENQAFVLDGTPRRAS